MRTRLQPRHLRLASIGTDGLVQFSPFDLDSAWAEKSIAGGVVVRNHVARIACQK